MKGFEKAILNTVIKFTSIVANRIFWVQIWGKSGSFCSVLRLDNCWMTAIPPRPNLAMSLYHWVLTVRRDRRADEMARVVCQKKKPYKIGFPPMGIEMKVKTGVQICFRISN